MSDYSPVTITKEKLEKLKRHIDERFDIFDGDGCVDIERCQLNVGYSIGTYYSTYNGLLLKEKQKLAEVTDSLTLARAKAYDDIKMGKFKYDLDSKGMTLMIEGHELVREKQKDHDKQSAYVKFLENVINQISFYKNGIQTIFNGESIKAQQDQ